MNHQGPWAEPRGGNGEAEVDPRHRHRRDGLGIPQPLERLGLQPRPSGSSPQDATPSMLNWDDDQRLKVGETTFRTMPPKGFDIPEPDEGEFLILKSRSLVERYATLIEELEPRHVFELGIYGGGSTLFFAELARPRRIVAIDRLPLKSIRNRVERCTAAGGLADVVRTFGEVDQADRGRLAQIVEESFDGVALDLVVDDCSHMYEPTRASFNELFPRMRPGGIYVIEDWRFAHDWRLARTPSGEMFPDQVPLTRLLFEIVLAIVGMPGLIAGISIEEEAALISRGEATVDPATFDVSACSNPIDRALLAPA